MSAEIERACNAAVSAAFKEHLQQLKEATMTKTQGNEPIDLAVQETTSQPEWNKQLQQITAGCKKAVNEEMHEAMTTLNRVVKFTNRQMEEVAMIPQELAKAVRPHYPNGAVIAKEIESAVLRALEVSPTLLPVPFIKTEELTSDDVVKTAFLKAVMDSTFSNSETKLENLSDAIMLLHLPCTSTHEKLTPTRMFEVLGTVANTMKKMYEHINIAFGALVDIHREDRTKEWFRNVEQVESLSSIHQTLLKFAEETGEHEPSLSFKARDAIDRLKGLCKDCRTSKRR